MSQLQPSGHDIYIKRLNPKGEIQITEHRVWDGIKFFAEQVKIAKKDNVMLAPSTREEYRQTNWSTK
jgi:hypothetical protein